MRLSVYSADSGIEYRNIAIGEALKGRAKALPDCIERYFEETEASVRISVRQLALSHIRTDGIVSAVERMREAYYGIRQKRVPIEVRPLGSKAFLVLDGNSTAAVAVLAGWNALPCRIAEAASE